MTATSRSMGEGRHGQAVPTKIGTNRRRASMTMECPHCGEDSFSSETWSVLASRPCHRCSNRALPAMGPVYLCFLLQIGPAVALGVGALATLYLLGIDGHSSVGRLAARIVTPATAVLVFACTPPAMKLYGRRRHLVKHSAAAVVCRITILLAFCATVLGTALWAIGRFG